MYLIDKIKNMFGIKKSMSENYPVKINRICFFGWREDLVKKTLRARVEGKFELANMYANVEHTLSVHENEFIKLEHEIHYAVQVQDYISKKDNLIQKYISLIHLIRNDHCFEKESSPLLFEIEYHVMILTYINGVCAPKFFWC